MNTRNIPQSRAPLIQLATRAYAGVQTVGVTLALGQNTPAAFGGDLHDYIGDPTATVNTGKIALLLGARDGMLAAQRNHRIAVEAGRKFCTDAVDSLKAHLGRSWNPQWAAAGFNQFSLRSSRTYPLDTLVLLRSYLQANPGRENPANGITAALALVRADAIRAALQALDTATRVRNDASNAHDESREQLRRRLRSLREELDLILDDDDNRWQDFGFSRPSDSRMPEVVTDLLLTPGTPGVVLVEFEDAPRAENYRVSWARNTSAPTFTEVGLFTDRLVNLRGLPSGVSIIVQVTARNLSGESQPTTATVTVP